MAESQIRWKQGDYIRLGQAVSKFNKKIRALQKEENKLYLPEERQYQDLKGEITTRKELNRILNSLKRFNQAGSEELYTTEAGEQITKWEREELAKAEQRVNRRINQEIQTLNEPGSTGFSRVQMGSQRYNELVAQQRNIKKLESLKGYEFKKLRERLLNIGTADYEMRKAIQYRNNVMENMQDLKNGYPQFVEIYNLLNNIKNPITFFETMQKSQVLEDFFSWYRDPYNYGGFEDVNELIDYIKDEYELGG